MLRLLICQRGRNRIRVIMRGAPGHLRSNINSKHTKEHMIVSCSVNSSGTIEELRLMSTSATRYTCSHPSHDTDMPCFPTWSALQSHMHTAHSPTCPHEHCHGRVFKSASRLKDHLKVHAERDADLARRAEEGRENMIGGLDVTNGEHGVDYVPDLVLEGMVDLKESRRAKKRRLSEVHGDIPGSANKLPRLLDGQEGKEFACEAQGCSRMFKTVCPHL